MAPPTLSPKTAGGLSLIILTLFCISFYPAIAELGKKWASSEEYTHAFITVPIIAFMIWRKRELLLNTADQSAYIGLLGLALIIPIYIFSLQLQVPTITFLCLLGTISASLIFLGGLKILYKLSTPLILLVLVIPIPDQIYSGITLPLQLKVSQISEWVIRMVGIPIFREGNVLQIPEKSFQVVEACSGMRSLIALVTLSLIISHFTLKRSRLKTTLILSTIPIAFAVNIIRVVSLLLAWHFFQTDLTQSAAHTTHGMFIFLISLVSLFGIQRGLARWDRNNAETRGNRL